MIRIFDPVLPDKELVKQSIDEIWETGQLTNFGKYCQLFEEEVKKYTGAKYVLAVSNCDTALKLCVKAMKMKNVVMPTFTFNSTYMAVAWSNIPYKIIDINPNTLLVDLDKVAAIAEDGHYKDFILVNVFGNMYGIDYLDFLRNKYGLNILFDSAHSFGSVYKGKKSGNLGFTECFSFSATKVITSGEGGVICTDDETLYNKLKYMRNYGFQRSYDSLYQGCNGKISELNAIVGYHSMKIFDSVLERKKRNINILKQALGSKYKFQVVADSVDSCYKDFVLLDIDYEKVSSALDIAGIQNKRYFLPLHRQHEVVEKANCERCVNANFVYENSICIPAHAKLSDEEIETICLTLNKI